MSDHIDTNDAEAPLEPEPNHRKTRPRAGPLLPEAGAAGPPLTAVIAVMSFLAVLAMAALLIINKAASDWTNDLRSEITVQIKGADAAEIAAGVSAALRVLNETEGVIEASERSQEETAALLAPWLGEGHVEEFLDIPAIIEVRATPALRNNLELLRTQLNAAAPGVSIDDHSRWHDRLASAARSGQALSLAIFGLVVSAACAISAFAARAGLESNKEIVTVLHLVGATDEFIAREVQRRFFVLGFRGAGLGLIAALVVLGLISVATRAGAGFENFLPPISLQWLGILWLLAVPIITCFVTALTARLTVLKALGEQF